MMHIITHHIIHHASCDEMMRSNAYDMNALSVTSIPHTNECGMMLMNACQCSLHINAQAFN
jgi:hypothetical protein